MRYKRIATHPATMEFQGINSALPRELLLLLSVHRVEDEKVQREREREKLQRDEKLKLCNQVLVARATPLLQWQ